MIRIFHLAEARPLSELLAMSFPDFLFYCHFDLRCTLKVNGESETRVFDTLADAVASARRMRRGERTLAQVFDVSGEVVTQFEM